MAATTETTAPFIVEKIRPPIPKRGKVSQHLGRVGGLDMGVQVVAPDDGETNLHSHPGLDTSWVVLDGEAIFYRDDEEIIATLQKNETILIPAGEAYWFKAGSEKPLVILHIISIQQGFERSSRMNHRPRTEQPHEALPGVFYEG
jgi:mannose-6-phosphate isomerase-like protein (cupin superfamily)